MRKLLIKAINYLEHLPGVNLKPSFCCFGVVDECFLRCKMCQKWKPDPNIQGVKRPDISQWKRAIASLRKITDEGFLINFGGGEPLLLDGLFELVRFASDLGFRTNIATNAYLIDEAMAKKIADSGLSTINLSLDSAKEAVHDTLRGIKGIYDRVMKAIEYLHKHCPGLKKGVCSVINGMNMDDVIGLVEVVEEDSRLDWIYFMAVMQPNNTEPDNDWYCNEDFNNLWPMDTEKIYCTIDKLIDFKNKGYKIVNHAAQLRAFKFYFSNPHKFVKTAPCNLSHAIHISSVGDIFICFNFKKLGNIESDSLEDLWNSDIARGVRQDIAECRKNCHFLINCFFEDDLPFSF